MSPLSSFSLVPFACLVCFGGVFWWCVLVVCFGGGLWAPRLFVVSLCFVYAAAAYREEPCVAILTFTLTNRKGLLKVSCVDPQWIDQRAVQGQS